MDDKKIYITRVACSTSLKRMWNEIFFRSSRINAIGNTALAGAEKFQPYCSDNVAWVLSSRCQGTTKQNILYTINFSNKPASNNPRLQ